LQTNLFGLVGQGTQSLPPISLGWTLRRKCGKNDTDSLIFRYDFDELLLEHRGKFGERIRDSGRAVTVSRDDREDLGDLGFDGRLTEAHTRHPLFDD
jgi:hypothetical protein